MISIHAPTRGATKPCRVKHQNIPNFNPRSHKGSDWADCQCLDAVANFNPRSHKGSDDLRLYCYLSPSISIHAPTRGATLYAFHDCWNYIEFQSTLPEGERQQFYTKFHICFISFLPILSPYHISTHSPLPTFNHFLYIFSGANRPEISCLLPFRTKTISGIL